MPITRKTRIYFFTPTNVLRDDGTTGGVRFLKYDKPTQETMQFMVNSAAFPTETEDRARVSTGGALGDEQGLAVLASDVQAKANITQLTDRSLVAQPHQLPTIASGTNNITTTISNFSGAVFNLSIDGGISTRNQFLVALSSGFITYFQDVINTLNTNLLDYIPLAGTNPSNPVTGAIEGNNDFRIYNDSNGGPVSEYKLFNLGITYGPPWNNFRTYNIGTGDYDTPQNWSLISQSPSATLIRSSELTGSAKSSVIQVSTAFSSAGGLPAVVLSSYGGAGVGIQSLETGFFGFFKTDTLLSVNRTYQLPDKNGTVALLSDIPVVPPIEVFNTTSSDSRQVDILTKTFTVASGLAWKKGNPIRAYRTSNNTIYMEGYVSSYSGTTLVMEIVKSVGTGTYSDWSITLGTTPNYTYLESIPTTAFGTSEITTNTITVGSVQITRMKVRAQATLRNVGVSNDSLIVRVYKNGLLLFSMENAVSGGEKAWVSGNIITQFAAPGGTPDVITVTVQATGGSQNIELGTVELQAIC